MIATVLIGGLLLFQQAGAAEHPLPPPTCDLGGHNSQISDPQERDRIDAADGMSTDNAKIDCTTQQRIAQAVDEFIRTRNGSPDELKKRFLIVDDERNWTVTLVPQIPSPGGGSTFGVDKQTFAVTRGLYSQ